MKNYHLTVAIEILFEKGFEDQVGLVKMFGSREKCYFDFDDELGECFVYHYPIRDENRLYLDKDLKTSGWERIRSQGEVIFSFVRVDDLDFDYFISLENSLYALPKGYYLIMRNETINMSSSNTDALYISHNSLDSEIKIKTKTILQAPTGQ